MCERFEAAVPNRAGTGPSESYIVVKQWDTRNSE